MPKPYDTIWQYLRDVALGYVLIIGGMIFAGAIAKPFRNVGDLAYPAALCIGLAPFWWFTRRCQIHDGDFYDYAALSAITLLAVAVSSALVGANQQLIEICIFAVVSAGLWGCWNRMRRKLGRGSGGLPHE